VKNNLQIGDEPALHPGQPGEGYGRQGGLAPGEQTRINARRCTSISMSWKTRAPRHQAAAGRAPPPDLRGMSNDNVRWKWMPRPRGLGQCGGRLGPVHGGSPDQHLRTPSRTRNGVDPGQHGAAPGTQLKLPSSPMTAWALPGTIAAWVAWSDLRPAAEGRFQRPLRAGQRQMTVVDLVFPAALDLRGTLRGAKGQFSVQSCVLGCFVKPRMVVFRRDQQDFGHGRQFRRDRTGRPPRGHNAAIRLQVSWASARLHRQARRFWWHLPTSAAFSKALLHASERFTKPEPISTS
jgi:hypothetical protein